MTALRAEFAVRLKLFSAIRANQLFGQSRLSIDLFSATGAENVILLQGLAALRADFSSDTCFAPQILQKSDPSGSCAPQEIQFTVFSLFISAPHLGQNAILSAISSLQDGHLRVSGLPQLVQKAFPAGTSFYSEDILYFRLKH